MREEMNRSMLEALEERVEKLEDKQGWGYKALEMLGWFLIIGALIFIGFCVGRWEGWGS